VFDDTSADPSLYVTHSPGEARERLSGAVDLLRREWRAGCQAGMAYETAFKSVRRLQRFAASEQVAGDLSKVIADLDAYKTLSVDGRRAALPAIASALNRLLPQTADRDDHYAEVAFLDRVDRAPQRSAPTVSASAPPRTLLEALHRLSPVAFEQLVADWLVAKGYADVQRVGGADDRGVDVLCRDSDGSLIAVQCKRYAPNKAGRRVGAPVVQLLSAMALQRRAHRGLLVTTATFTESARRQAYDFDIELVDGDALVAELQDFPGLVQSTWGNFE
jgi:HJR/Mrr/RecB family endonuclease